MDSAFKFSILFSRVRSYLCIKFRAFIVKGFLMVVESVFKDTLSGLNFAGIKFRVDLISRMTIFDISRGFNFAH